MFKTRYVGQTPKSYQLGGDVTKLTKKLGKAASSRTFAREAATGKILAQPDQSGTTGKHLRIHLHSVKPPKPRFSNLQINMIKTTPPKPRSLSAITKTMAMHRKYTYIHRSKGHSILNKNS